MSTTVGDSGQAIALRKMQKAIDQTSLFCLPPELRLMVWKLLIPGRRVFGARNWAPNKNRSDDRRSIFGLDPKPSQPILSQICAESRQCLLDYGHGHFVFGLEGETGLWWGPEDVLLFQTEQECFLGPCIRPPLQELEGLHRVKNIALDPAYAQSIYYEYSLPKNEADQGGSDDSDQEDEHEDDDRESSEGDAESVATEPHPQRISLGSVWTHPLEHFRALDSLTVVFERVVKAVCLQCGTCHSVPATGNWLMSQFLDSGSPFDHITLDRDSSSMDEAVAKLSELRRLWIQVNDQPRWMNEARGDGFVIYDLCVDKSFTEPPHAPVVVTAQSMMDNEEWAF